MDGMAEPTSSNWAQPIGFLFIDEHKLLDTTDTWYRLLDRGSAVDTSYLDFAKAFESAQQEVINEI